MESFYILNVFINVSKKFLVVYGTIVLNICSQKLEVTSSREAKLILPLGQSAIRLQKHTS